MLYKRDRRQNEDYHLTFHLHNTLYLSKCTQNFIILNQVVAEKTLTKNVHMCYIGVTEGKIEKEGKMSFSNFIFIYTIHLAYLKMFTKFKNTGSNRSGEIIDRNFH